MKSALCGLLFFSIPVCAGECLRYVEQVELRGTLSSQTFPEQPNYESIEAGDAPASYFFLLPDKPFCVSAGSAEDEVAEDGITEVQLVFNENPDANYAALRPYLGRDVVCGGTFMHSTTGHHHSSVLLWQAKCTRGD